MAYSCAGSESTNDVTVISVSVADGHSFLS